MTVTLPLWSLLPFSLHEVAQALPPTSNFLLSAFLGYALYLTLNPLTLLLSFVIWV